MDRKTDNLVSVIIPFFSNKNWLQSAINSVLDQTYKDYEIIVINDGSRENIEDIILKYTDKIIYFYQENSGPASARNKGIRHSKGSYIAFLDSDDIWKNNKLELQVRGMIENDYYWSHSAYELFSEKNDLINVVNLEYFKNKIYPLILTSCKIATPTVIIKKELFDDEDMFFNETQRFGQDSFLWIRIATKYPVHYTSESLVKVRIRGNNAAKRAFVQLKSRSQIWSNINDNKEKFNIKEIPKAVKFGFRLSSLGYSIVKSLSPKLSVKFIEIISRFLYFPPWLIFKTSYYIMRTKQ